MERHFNKRSGTTDRGKDYEHLYTAYLILKLLVDDDVENFYLSSNDQNFGAFDDVVVEISYKQCITTHALQLKHKNGGGFLTEKHLNGSKEFNIGKYFESYETMDKSSEVILFTNCRLKDFETIELTLKEQKVCFKMEKRQANKWLSTLEDKECCVFTMANESEEYNEFFQMFRFYSNQMNVRKLKDETLELFMKTFKTNERSFNEFIYFVTEWSMMDGKKLKLDKEWMKRAITICVLTPVIKPLSICSKSSISDKERLLRRAFSELQVSAIYKENYKTIKHLWSDIVSDLNDFAKVNEVKRNYQLTVKYITKNEDLDGEDNAVSVLLWLLGKCPLVVEETPQVEQVLKLCKSSKDTFIIVESAKNFRSDAVLRNLSEGLCRELVAKFTYSLEGQREETLKRLIETCQDVVNAITMNHLVQMLDGPLPVGAEADLPPCHIERRLLKILVEFYFVRQCEDALVFVGCVEDATAFQQLLSSGVLSDTDYKGVSRLTLPQKLIVYINEKQFTQKQVNSLCEQNSSIANHHQFNYLDESLLEWIISQCEDDTHFYNLAGLRMTDKLSSYIHEKDLNYYVVNNVNIICANPGMGKSTLAISCKRNTSSLTRIIVISARSHVLQFRECGPDVDKFLEYILNYNSEGVQNEDIFGVLKKTKRIQLFWDGLDEASDETLKIILHMVEVLAEKGVVQWLTSRKNLRHMLEERFRVLSRGIREFDEEEQKEYIQNRLHIPESELQDTFSKIQANIVSFSNNNILGIPLQIYMLTELFSTNEENMKLLDGIFTVLDLYEHFVNEKFNTFFGEKMVIDMNNEFGYLLYQDTKRSKVRYYKSLAVKLYLSDLLTETVIRDSETFLSGIEKTGDAIGLISKVVSDIVEFSHNSYGEYFAALFLFEHDSHKARDNTFISDGKYNNIRFFLDLMLSKNCKAFVAVLYRNTVLLENCESADLSSKDKINRSVFEVACQYEKTNSVEIIKEGDKPNKQTKVDCDSIANKFSDVFSMMPDCIKRLTLFLPFLTPLWDKEFKDFATEYSLTVLYYAIRFDCATMFACSEHSDSLKTIFNKTDPTKLLYLALENESFRVLQRILLDKKFDYRSLQNYELILKLFTNIKITTLLLRSPDRNNTYLVDVPNGIGQYLIHLACESAIYARVLLLLTEGSKIDVADADGQTPLHYACANKAGYEIVKLLVDTGVKINVWDAKGRMPIHNAIHNENGFEMVKLLLDRGAEIDTLDADSRMLLHHACKKEHGYEIVKLLIGKGVAVNVADAKERMPIHYACKNKMGFDIVQALIKVDSRLDVPDVEGRKPIHYGCANETGNQITRLLIDHGVKINDVDRNGQMPIHYACANRFGINFMTLELLLKKGAKADVPGANGRTPVHYACQNPNGYKRTKILLAAGARVNLPDADGCSPIHYAVKNDIGLPLVELLITAGASFDCQDADGRTPVHYASQVRMHGDIMEFFISKGAKVNMPDAYMRTPLHFACEIAKNEFIVKLLLDQGAHVNARDSKGQTPIHYACARGHSSVVQVLIDRGAEVSVMDADGRLPLDYARENARDSVPYISKVTQNADGGMLMEYARDGDHIVEMLIEKSDKID